METEQLKSFSATEGQHMETMMRMKTMTQRDGLFYPSQNDVPLSPPTPEKTLHGGGSTTTERNSMVAMREVIYRIAAMQPVHIDPESVKPPRRKNVKISTDPQSIAARRRRERISEKIRILQRLVPGGTKMDTASMLDEAIHYVKFLKTQVRSLQRAAARNTTVCNNSSGNDLVDGDGMGFPVPVDGSLFMGMMMKSSY